MKELLARDRERLKPLADRLLELALDSRQEEKKRLWMAENVADDHILWPTVLLPALVRREVDWGVYFEMLGSRAGADDPLEAKRMVPAFPQHIEAERVRFTDQQIDEEATQKRLEQARELLGDRLRVWVRYPDLSYAPFDLAVRMRGLESLLLDTVDNPGGVHALMEAVTAALAGHHRTREARAWINCFPDPEGRWSEVGFRVHCAYLEPGPRTGFPRLADEWAYVSAQTSSGLGPEMFAEFVHPYNCRLASLFHRDTVYYHGCECLDQKLEILAALPHLRRFHVSPWSSVAAAAGAPLDLNLSDIHSLNGRPELLRLWAEQAQEVACSA